MSGLWTLEQGRIRLTPHKAQWEVLQSNRRFTWFIAGTQSGKTVLGPWWLWRTMRRFGPGDYLAATATYDLFKLKMLPELQDVFCSTLGLGVYRPTDRLIECHDGSRIILRSASSPGGLESATAKAAWLDECGQDDFDLAAWEATQRRLSLSQGPVLGTTTPYNLGWLKTEVVDRAATGDADYLVIQAPSTVNPAFPLAEFQRAQRVLPAWKFNMFYRGLFERPVGLIYQDYVDTCDGGHLVKPFEIPAEWPRWVGIDFGAINTATVWLAEDVERKAFFVYRETLEGNMSTKEHVQAALRRAQAERVVAWTGGSQSEVQPRSDWRQNGIRVIEPYIGAVESGIDRVTELFRERRLFVCEDCRMIRDELARYMRVVDQNGLVTEEIKNKNAFHLLDALRYAVINATRPLREAQSRQG